MIEDGRILMVLVGYREFLCDYQQIYPPGLYAVAVLVHYYALLCKVPQPQEAIVLGRVVCLAYSHRYLNWLCMQVSYMRSE